MRFLGSFCKVWVICVVGSTPCDGQQEGRKEAAHSGKELNETWPLIQAAHLTHQVTVSTFWLFNTCLHQEAMAESCLLQTSLFPLQQSKLEYI